MRDTNVTRITQQDIIADFVTNTCPTDADGEISRVATNFGLVAAAGEIAIQNGILPWETGRAFDAAMFEFKQWLKYRGGTKSDKLL